VSLRDWRHSELGALIEDRDFLGAADRLVSDLDSVLQDSGRVVSGVSVVVADFHHPDSEVPVSVVVVVLSAVAVAVDL